MDSPSLAGQRDVRAARRRDLASRRGHLGAVARRRHVETVRREVSASIARICQVVLDDQDLASVIKLGPPLGRGGIDGDPASRRSGNKSDNIPDGGRTKTVYRRGGDFAPQRPPRPDPRTPAGP